MVKADAYGIGIAQAVPVLRAMGCRTFFVALPEEGRLARTVAPDAVIYVLNGYLPSAEGLYRNADLRPVLNTLETADAWARGGDGAHCAIHVDTGMNRLGLSLHEALILARDPARLAGLRPALIISHLACADLQDKTMNAAQLALFNEIRAEFPELPASLANSAGIKLGGDYHLDMVRPGIALYGGAVAAGGRPMRNVVTAQARILQVRDASAGEPVGYGAAERLGRDSRIAVVAAGYADGYLRGCGSEDGRKGASAVVRGRTVPLVGRVSMDLITLDVTEVPGVSPGDWVELFGANMPVDEVARAAGSIGYELLTGLSRRAERLHVNAPELN